MDHGIVRHVIKWHDCMDIGSLKTAKGLIMKSQKQTRDEMELGRRFNKDDDLDWFIKALGKDMRREQYAMDLIETRLNMLR